MEIQLILSDMDGTLLDGESNLPAEFDSVFHQLLQQNRVFGIASGRPWASLKEKFPQIHQDMAFICENGGCVVYQDQVLHVGKIEKKDWMEVVVKVRETRECSLILCGLQQSYIEDCDERLLQIAYEFYPQLVIVENLEDVEEEIVKMSIRDYEGTEINTQQVFKNFNSKLDFAASDTHWLDIMPAGSSKAKGVEVLCQHLHCTPDQVMAFGDHFNDYEMLKAVKYSYAMENAIDEVKAICSSICDSNINHGVIKVVKDTFNLK